MRVMRKTNSKEFMKEMQEYLLGSITNEEWTSEPTPKEKINYLFQRLESEKGDKHNLMRYPNTQDRLADFLQGMATNVAAYNYEILEVSAKLHDVDGFTDKMEDKIIGNWFNFCAFKFIQIHRKLNK